MYYGMWIICPPSMCMHSKGQVVHGLARPTILCISTSIHLVFVLWISNLNAVFSSKDIWFTGIVLYVLPYLDDYFSKPLRFVQSRNCHLLETYHHCAYSSILRALTNTYMYVAWNSIFYSTLPTDWICPAYLSSMPVLPDPPVSCGTWPA